jgi:hypothetical protein
MEDVFKQFPEIKAIREGMKERKEMLERFERMENLLKAILQELKKLNLSFEKK